MDRKYQINTNKELITVVVLEKQLEKYIRNRKSVFNQRAFRKVMIEKFGHMPKKPKRKAFKQTGQLPTT